MTEFDAAPLKIGKVVLTVRDLGRVGRFYQEVIGLHEIAGDGGSALLGVGSAVLLELRRDAQARLHSPRDAGLFHTAFLLPTRGDLARWTRHAVEGRVAIQGASDHVVSEALYLADPEGNGIEIYADRPAAEWEWAGGAVTMRTDPLDMDGLLASAGPQPWTGLPEGTTVGHVHLQVGSLAPAEAFYGDGLGFQLTARYPGGSFYSSGGYHHHVATNIWNSRNAPVRTEPTTGLADFEIVVADPSVLEAAASRLQAAGAAVSRRPSGLSLRDPWGTPLSLVSRPA